MRRFVMHTQPTLSHEAITGWTIPALKPGPQKMKLRPCGKVGSCSAGHQKPRKNRCFQRFVLPISSWEVLGVDGDLLPPETGSNCPPCSLPFSLVLRQSPRSHTLHFATNDGLPDARASEASN